MRRLVLVLVLSALGALAAGLAAALRIADGLIPSVAKSETTSAEEAEDLAGCFVAPGLIDMHVHYPPALAVGNAELWSLLLLAHGVTSVREMGNIEGSIFRTREAIRDGSPPFFPSNRVVRTPAEARLAVEEQAARGADCIKVYNMLAQEVLAAIRAAASASAGTYNRTNRARLTAGEKRG